MPLDADITSEEVSTAIQSLRKFSEAILTVSVLDWPAELGHPYAFQWSDTLVERKFVAYLVPPRGREFDFPSRELLSLLMHRFRIAAFRRRAAGKPASFRAHRWVWYTKEELMRDACLSRSQVDRALRRLEELGIIHKEHWYDLGNILHIRPTTDIFRLGHAITLFSADNGLSAYREQIAPYASDTIIPTDAAKCHGKVVSEMFEFHADRLQSMFKDFTFGDRQKRFEEFYSQWQELFGEVMPGVVEAFVARARHS